MTAPIGISWEGAPYIDGDVSEVRGGYADRLAETVAPDVLKRSAEIVHDDSLPSRIHAARDNWGEMSEGIIEWRPSLWERFKKFWLTGTDPGAGERAVSEAPYIPWWWGSL